MPRRINDKPLQTENYTTRKYFYKSGMVFEVFDENSVLLLQQDLRNQTDFAYVSKTRIRTHYLKQSWLSMNLSTYQNWTTKKNGSTKSSKLYRYLKTYANPLKTYAFVERYFQIHFAYKALYDQGPIELIREILAPEIPVLDSTRFDRIMENKVDLGRFYNSQSASKCVAFSSVKN